MQVINERKMVAQLDLGDHFPPLKATLSALDNTEQFVGHGLEEYVNRLANSGESIGRIIMILQFFTTEDVRSHIVDTDEDGDESLRVSKQKIAEEFLTFMLFCIRSDEVTEALKKL